MSLLSIDSMNRLIRVDRLWRGTGSVRGAVMGLASSVGGVGRVSTASNLRTYSQTSTPTEAETEDEYVMDVANLPSRWLRLSGDDQLDIINYLNVKQQFGWRFLSADEKKAIYYISYGEWGPRDHKNMNFAEMVFKVMSSSILFGVVGFSLLNYAGDKAKVAELEGASGEKNWGK